MIKFKPWFGTELIRYSMIWFGLVLARNWFGLVLILKKPFIPVWFEKNENPAQINP